MSLRDELRDPWGWVVAGVSGGLGWAVLASAIAGPAAIAVGAGIGAAVLGSKVGIGLARSGTARGGSHDGGDDPGRRRDRLPEPPAGSPQKDLHTRAEFASQRLDELAQRPSDPWVIGRIEDVRQESGAVVEAVAELAGRVTVLDASLAAARPESLVREIADLQSRIARTSDPSVRTEQQRALAALDAQADSVDRLLRRRDGLLAQMQAAVVGLEGLATRVGELVALGSASRDTEAASRIVGDLTSSLDAVRAGVEEAQSILREL